MFFSRAYWTAMILPSMPRLPKPPGTRMPLHSSVVGWVHERCNVRTWSCRGPARQCGT